MGRDKFRAYIDQTITQVNFSPRTLRIAIISSALSLKSSLLCGSGERQLLVCKDNRQLHVFAF